MNADLLLFPAAPFVSLWVALRGFVLEANACVLASSLPDVGLNCSSSSASATLTFGYAFSLDTFLGEL